LKEKTECGLLYSWWLLAAHRIDPKYMLHTSGLREAEAAETRGQHIEGLYPILRIGAAVLEQRPDCVGYAVSI
jgi:hypothetical protein